MRRVLWGSLLTSCGGCVFCWGDVFGNGLPVESNTPCSSHPGLLKWMPLLAHHAYQTFMFFLVVCCVHPAPHGLLSCPFPLPAPYLVGVLFSLAPSLPSFPQHPHPRIPHQLPPRRSCCYLLRYVLLLVLCPLGNSGAGVGMADACGVRAPSLFPGSSLRFLFIFFPLFWGGHRTVLAVWPALDCAFLVYVGTSIPFGECA